MDKLLRITSTDSNDAGRKLSQELKNHINDFDTAVTKLIESKNFKPSQQKAELLFMMNLIRDNNYSKICEIGTFKGGTTICFCLAAPVNAKIVTIDINITREKQRLLKDFTKKGQKITSLRGDTRRLSTYLKTQYEFRGEDIDFLLIDGDHSLEGVMNDYVRYSPLVRKGGTIIFHDIHPDSFIRDGVKTTSNVGDVPSFWQLLSSNLEGSSTFIEDPNQDGFGLGIIKKK